MASLLKNLLGGGSKDREPAEDLLALLQEMRQEPDFLALASSFKRVMNILSQSESSTEIPDPSLMIDPAETALWQSYLEICPAVEASGKSHLYGEALRRMASSGRRREVS